MSDAKQVSKESIPITLGRGFSYLINFVIVVILARVLSPYDFGVLSLGLSIMILLHAINNFGVETALPYFIPKLIASNKLPQAVYVYKRVLKFRAVTSLILGLLLLMSSQLISEFYSIHSLFYVLIILSFGLIAYSILYLYQNVFQAFKKMFYVMFPDVVFSILRLLLLLATLYLGLIGITIGYVVSIFLSLIIVLFISYKKVIPRVNPELTNFKEFKKYSLIIYIGIIGAYLASNINLLIIGVYPEHAAYLSLSQKMGMFLTLPAVSLAISLFPELSGKLNKESFTKMFKDINHYAIIISSFASFLVLTISKELIELFFGTGYAPGLLTFQLMMIYFFFQGAFINLSTFYTSKGRTKRYVIAVLFQASLSTALTIILLWQKSIGAAIAGIISSLIYGIILIFRSDYPKKTFLKSLIVGFIPTIVSLISFNNSIIDLFIHTILFSLLFVLSGCLLKLIGKKDFILLYKFVRYFKNYLSKVI